MQSPPVVPLRLSPSLRIGAVLAHVMPLSALLAPEVPGWARMLVCVIVAASAWRGYRHVRRIHDDHLRLKTEGAPELSHASNAAAAEVLPSSTDMGPLIVLHLRDGDGRIHRYPLTPDGMDAEQWRGLKIWFRWRAKNAAPSPEA